MQNCKITFGKWVSFIGMYPSTLVRPTKWSQRRGIGNTHHFVCLYIQTGLGCALRKVSPATHSAAWPSFLLAPDDSSQPFHSCSCPWMYCHFKSTRGHFLSLPTSLHCFGLNPNYVKKRTQNFLSIYWTIDMSTKYRFRSMSILIYIYNIIYIYICTVYIENARNRETISVPKDENV
jgi:hypothetical protein